MNLPFIWRKKAPGPDWGFQMSAIRNVLADFRENRSIKTLLVIPTGGGKTLVAIRSINEMYKSGLLKQEDKVLWVVHTFSLRANALNALANQENRQSFGFIDDLAQKIDVCMKTDAVTRLASSHSYKLIVIDEAHHAAANTYREFFEQPIAILGLTATPTRMDKKELPFKKISFSITFRELVDRKVVLTPKFLPEVKTRFRIDISSLHDEAQLERFNSRERNELIAEQIFQEAAKYNLKKIIVFAGTNAHVERLYSVLREKNEKRKMPFKHVGYIYGGDKNEQNISNDDYLTWHHDQESSILVNCRILNEGYDDPSIDTVVMATPTSSILYYLQCIGRVVRTPKNFMDARAYVIEIVDQLPNVSYRIDNRWLYAEISDFLEPHIIDIKLIWPISVALVLLTLLIKKVRLSDIPYKPWRILFFGGKVNFLLFNDLPDSASGRWRVWAMPSELTEPVQMFNELSESIAEYYPLNHDYILEQRYSTLMLKHPLSLRSYRSALFAALRRAFLKKEAKQKVDSLVYISTR